MLPCICQRQIRKAEPRGIIGAEPLGIRSGEKFFCPVSKSRKNLGPVIRLFAERITPRTRAPARRREPCICRRQIRKAEPRGIIGGEPLGIESGAKKFFAPSPNVAKNKAPSSDGALFFAAFGDWICTYRRSRKQLNSFVSANVVQIKRLQVVNFVVFCVVLAYFLKNPCHNTIFSNMKIKDYSRHRIIPAPAPGMATQQPAHSKI